MKALHRTGGSKPIDIGVLDDKSYYAVRVGTTGKDSKTPGAESRQHMHYFNRLADALVWAAGQVARSEAQDLREFVALLRTEREKIEQAIGEEF